MNPLGPACWFPRREPRGRYQVCKHDTLDDTPCVFKALIPFSGTRKENDIDINIACDEKDIRRADGIVLVYSVTDRESLSEVIKIYDWVREVKVRAAREVREAYQRSLNTTKKNKEDTDSSSHASDPFDDDSNISQLPIILVGNKTDLLGNETENENKFQNENGTNDEEKNKREVSTAEAAALAKHLHLSCPPVETSATTDPAGVRAAFLEVVRAARMFPPPPPPPPPSQQPTTKPKQSFPTMKKMRKTAKRIGKWYKDDLKPALTDMRKTLAGDARILAKALFPLKETRAEKLTAKEIVGRIAWVPLELGILACIWVMVRVFGWRFCPCGNAKRRGGRQRGFDGCSVHED